MELQEKSRRTLPRNLQRVNVAIVAIGALTGFPLRS
jgi:hypothetical protein